MKLAKLKAFSAFDSKLEEWKAPFFVPHTGQAERTWQDICNDPNSLACKYPEDYTLFQIGEFDDSTGILSSIAPVHVMAGIAAKKQDKALSSGVPIGRIG